MGLSRASSRRILKAELFTGRCVGEPLSPCLRSNITVALQIVGEIVMAIVLCLRQHSHK
jgi:hypothetical protein